MQLSVIIPTYNPDAGRLAQTLAALQKQTLLKDAWELIIIDNNSSNQFENQLNLSWHPSARLIKESRQGLTYARLRGFNEAKGQFIVMVDDDNILNAGYLQKATDILRSASALGAIGGKSIPLFEHRPPAWLTHFYGNLALRDLGEEALTESWQNKYPNCAPIGAGMVIRKKAIESYINKISSGKNIVSDRTGLSLTSGGDNDLVIEVLKAGWLVGYFPELELQHIIPAQRLQTAYLARLVNNTNRSWVQLLQNHGISPWKKIKPVSVLPRKIKAWFSYKAWLNKANYIKWQGACGLYDGLAN